MKVLYHDDFIEKRVLMKGVGVYGLNTSLLEVFFCIKKAGSLGLERTCEGGKLHHVFTYIIQYLSIVVKTKS